MVFSIEKQIQSTPHAPIVTDRLQNLREEAAKKNVVLRDDSRTAYEFAIGNETDIDLTVRKLAVITSLYDSTSYGCDQQAKFQIIANFVKSNFPSLSWSAVWKLTKVFAPPILKLIAARELQD